MRSREARGSVGMVPRARKICISLYFEIPEIASGALSGGGGGGGGGGGEGARVYHEALVSQLHACLP